MWLLLLPLLLLLLLLIITLYHHLRDSSSKGRLRLPPGPFAFPIVGSLHLLGSLPHQSLATLAKRYGPLMYLHMGSFPTLVVSSPSMAKEVLGTHDFVFANRPRIEMGTRLFYDHRTLALLPYGPQWWHIRKLYALKIFASRSLLGFNPLQEAEMATTLHFLSPPLVDEETSKVQVVNLTEVLSSLSTSTIMGMVISKRLPQGAQASKLSEMNIDDASMVISKGLLQAQASMLREMMDELSLLSGAPLIGDLVPCLKWVWDPNGYLKRMTKVHLLWDCFLDQLINERRRKDSVLDPQNWSGKGDFLDVLLSVDTDANVGASVDNDTYGAYELDNISTIKALVLELLVAGKDTTFAAMNWAMVELLRNPYTLQRLQEELDLSVGRTRAVALDDVVNLKYLHVVVKETFRLHPSAPLLAPHLASESCNIGGYMIPKGTKVLVNAWAIGRDESTWVRPLEFWPGRFMEEEGNTSNIDVKGHHFELLPFGAGRRGCPGMALALNFVQFVVASLVHTSDWSYAPGHGHGDDGTQGGSSLNSHTTEALLVVPKSRGVPIMTT